MNCPNCHLTTSTDYCSVCGVKISAVTDPEPAQNQAPVQSTMCPKCQTSQLDPNAQFCENCGHKLDDAPQLSTPAESQKDAAIASSVSTETPAAPIAPVTASGATTGWRIEYRVFQGNTGADEEATPVKSEGPGDLLLKNQVTLIGRTSPKRNLYPEIACDWDDAVSHRHAQIELDADGHPSLTDLGSTNGTMLNGKLITSKTPVKLQDGDRITLGGKTALVVHKPEPGT
jgi:hypothetical protein